MVEGIAAFRTSLPPGSSFTYASASPELFSRSGHFTGVALTTNGKTVTAATLAVSPGEGRTLRHLAATKVTGKTPGAQVNMEQFDIDGLTMPLLAANVTDIDPAAITFDHAAAHGIRSMPDGGGSLDTADLTVDGYGPGKMTTIDVADVAANLNDMPVDHFSLGSARLRGLPLADAIAHLQSGDGAWPRSLNYALDLANLSVTAGGRPFVTLGSFSTASDPKGSDQFESRLDMKELVVINTPNLTPGLSELGYDRFQGGMQMHATVDRKAQQMRMDRLDIDAPAMGRLHLALGLDNVPSETMSPASGQVNSMAFMAMLQAKLQSAELTYEDHSLANKAFASAATQQKMTPAELKQTDIAMLKATGTQFHLSPAVLDPIIAFINDPHRLVVAVKPPQPIVLMNLSGVATDLQHGLGLSVTN